MRLSRLLNVPMGWLGYKIIRRADPTQKLEDSIPRDIGLDGTFMDIYTKVKDFTLVDIERSYALYQSVKYIIKNNIPGDFVECGVWKGGSCMLIALVLKEAGISNRTIHLYDTFEGMVKPGLNDGQEESQIWENSISANGFSNWCYSPLEEVQRAMESTGYPREKLQFIKGRVEDNIPYHLPPQIALLRLDTDWYESTSHELKHLYPQLVKGGVLILDDYGAWIGAKKAVDEYFENYSNLFLHRIDYTGRLVVK